MADAIFKQCMDEIRGKIIALQLEGASPDEIKVDYRPWELLRFDKRITIHPMGEILSHGGTCCRDDIGYNVQVSMIYPKVGDLARALSRLTTWRECIRKKFHNQRLSAIDSVWKCEVKPASKIPREFERDQHEPHAMVVVCWSREARDC